MGCHRRFGRVWAAGLLVFIATAGCSRSPLQTKEQLLEGGKAFAAQQKYPEAILQYRSAVQLDPRFGEARYELAEAYLKTNDVAKALDEMVRAADLMPDNVDVNLKAGSLLLLAQSYEDASARADLVLAKDSKNVQAQLLKGSAAAGLKDFDAAFAELDEAIKMDPLNAGSLAMLGALQVDRGRAAEAEETFKRAEAAAPMSSATQMALAGFYLSAGRPEEAEAPLKRAIELDPRNRAAHATLATYYVSVGRLPEAEAPLKTIETMEKSVPARVMLADYYVRTERLSEAIAILERAAAEKDGFVAATVRLAIIDHDQKRTEEAFRKIDAVLAKTPGSGEALATKARFLMAERRMDEALVQAKAALAANPRSPATQSLLGAIYVAQNEVDDAVAAFGEVVKLNPKALGAQLQLAELHLRKGAGATALELAEEVVRQVPRHPAARITLANALVATGDIDRALATRRDLARDFPNAAPVHAELGGMLLATKDVAGAKREFDRALELDPTSVEAVRGRIAIELDAKNAAGVRAELEKRLKQSPRQPGLLLLAATTFGALRDTAQQEAMLRRLIDADPAGLQGYLALAGLYVKQGKLDLARAEYETIAKRQPKSVTASTMVGLILEAQGKTAEAQKTYEQVLARSQDAALAANNLAWLYAENGGNLDIALQLAQTAKRQLPNQPQINDTLGWVYYRKGLAALAIPPLLASISTDPKHPTYRYHAGLAYAKSGDKVKAREAFDEALRLKPDFREAQEALAALRTN